MSNPIKVTFFTPFKELQETMPPVPASKFWTQWFKDAPGTRPGTEWYHKDSRTVKSCPGILDMLNMGYIIPLWADYKVTRQ